MLEKNFLFYLWVFHLSYGACFPLVKLAITNREIKIIPETTYPNAHQTCQKKGGRLLEIGDLSSRDLNLLKNTLLSLGMRGTFWVGIYSQPENNGLCPKYMPFHLDPPLYDPCTVAQPALCSIPSTEEPAISPTGIIILALGALFLSTFIILICTCICMCHCPRNPTKSAEIESTKVVDKAEKSPTTSAKTKYKVRFADTLID